MAPIYVIICVELAILTILSIPQSKYPVCTVPTFNSCTKCVGSRDIIHDRTPDCTQFSEYGCHHKSQTLQLNVALIRKLRGSLLCLVYFVDFLYIGVCKTMHWETSGRLVQELNICTVSTFYETERVSQQFST